jgi:hypothetical protein
MLEELLLHKEIKITISLVQFTAETYTNFINRTCFNVCCLPADRERQGEGGTEYVKEECMRRGGNLA